MRTGTPVSAVRSLGPAGPVALTAADGEAEYDAVLLATHSDVSLKILGQEGPQVGSGGRPAARVGLQSSWEQAALAVAVAVGLGALPSCTEAACRARCRASRLRRPPHRCPLQELRDVLGAIPYSDNDVYLHTDEALMPRRRATWASWNFLGRSGDAGNKCVGRAWRVGAAAAAAGGSHAIGWRRSHTAAARRRGGPWPLALPVRSGWTLASPPCRFLSRLCHLSNHPHAFAPAAARAAVCVTYWANRLQPLPAGAPNLFVTLNPIEPPAADKTHRRLTLSHPVFSFASDAAQRALPAAQARASARWQGAAPRRRGHGGLLCAAACFACTPHSRTPASLCRRPPFRCIPTGQGRAAPGGRLTHAPPPLPAPTLPIKQGKGGLYLAGAWAGYGFHEDGIKSAVDAVAAMGAWPSLLAAPLLMHQAAAHLLRTLACCRLLRGSARRSNAPPSHTRNVQPAAGVPELPWAPRPASPTSLHSFTPPHPAASCTGAPELPWVPRSVSPKIPLLDRAAARLFDRFARAAIKTGYLRLVLPSGEELVYGDRAHSEAPVPKGEPRGGVGTTGAQLHAWQPARSRERPSRHSARATGAPRAAAAAHSQARSGGAGRRCAPPCASSTLLSSARSSRATTPVRADFGSVVFSERLPCMRACLLRNHRQVGIQCTHWVRV